MALIINRKRRGGPPRPRGGGNHPTQGCGGCCTRGRLFHSPSPRSELTSRSRVLASPTASAHDRPLTRSSYNCLKKRNTTVNLKYQRSLSLVVSAFALILVVRHGRNAAESVHAVIGLGYTNPIDAHHTTTGSLPNADRLLIMLLGSSSLHEPKAGLTHVRNSSKGCMDEVEVCTYKSKVNSLPETQQPTVFFLLPQCLFPVNALSVD